jgi:hypothetical protein
MNAPMSDSPVDIALKAGLRSDGNWPGFSAVYRKISDAAERIGCSSSRLSEFHVDTMADLGSGHEERMKWRLHWLRTYGWLE